VLGTLLRHKTAFAYKTFRDIVMAEPPVLNLGKDNWQTNSRGYYDRTAGTSLLAGLSDTLQLTRSILPDLLPLINLDDYKYPIMSLLGEMVDSGLVKPDDYKSYLPKFLLEAKQEWKKQVITEKQEAIHKAEAEWKEKNMISLSYSADGEDEDDGNGSLE